MAAEGNGAVEQDASRGHGAKKRIGYGRSGRGRIAKKMAADKEFILTRSSRVRIELS
jgi:hypothetical protein